MSKAALTEPDEIKKGIERAEYVKKGLYSFFMFCSAFGELFRADILSGVQRSWLCMLPHYTVPESFADQWLQVLREEV